MTRNRLVTVLLQLPVLGLLLGLLVFGLGIGLQYLLNRRMVMTLVGSDASPFVPVALAGLCMATLMLLIWCTGIGFLLARQTRLHGADYSQAYQLMDAFQFDDAIPLLENSIDSGKETVEVLTLLARAYAYAGQYSRAHGMIDRAVELHPDEAEPYGELGSLFLLEGSDDQAISALQTAVNKDPSPANWADLGLAFVFARRSSEAQIALDKASQGPLPTPQALRVYFHLMQTYTAAGDAPKAASAAAKMISAREGLATWEYELRAARGTGYGQRLTREIQAITKAFKEADDARMTV